MKTWPERVFTNTMARSWYSWYFSYGCSNFGGKSFWFWLRAGKLRQDLNQWDAVVEKSEIVTHLGLFLHFHHSCSEAVDDQWVFCQWQAGICCDDTAGALVIMKSFSIDSNAFAIVLLQPHSFTYPVILLLTYLHYWKVNGRAANNIQEHRVKKKSFVASICMSVLNDPIKGNTSV